MSTIAIVSPGEMGAAIGGELTAQGHRVTCLLAGRGMETRLRAREAGMEERADWTDLLRDCDLFLSILPPAQAEALAATVASHAAGRKHPLTFVDCNAISPRRVRRIAALFEETPTIFIDAGLVGPPPDGLTTPRLYCSGPTATLLTELDGIAFTVHALGDEIGAASGLKMTYAAITKGVNTLLLGALLTAERSNLLDPLLAELEDSQTALLARIDAAGPRMPADAGRWIGEMEEIADTFADQDVTPAFHRGAADIMRLLDASPFGRETRRTRDTDRDLRGTLKGL